MKTENEVKAAIELKSELEMFTGTEDYHCCNALWSRDFKVTDGVKFLAEEAGAYWLLDIIAFAQQETVIKNSQVLKQFQLWELEVRENKTAKITCGYDTEKPVWSQEIPFTDFPLDEIKLYVCHNFLMLTSEY
jgi:hypothetical protein